MKIGKAVSWRIVATVLFLIGIAWLTLCLEFALGRWRWSNLKMQLIRINGIASSLLPFQINNHL